MKQRARTHNVRQGVRENDEKCETRPIKCRRLVNIPPEEVVAAIVRNDFLLVKSMVRNTPWILDTHERFSFQLPNSYTRVDASLLAVAVAYKRFQIVNYFLSRGAYVDAYSFSLSGMVGDVSIARVLLEHGANIHANDDAALFLAAENGHDEMVRFLVEQGANIHAKNDRALCWSAKNGHETIVEYLLDKGANVHANDDFALVLSAEEGNAQIIKLLIQRGANVCTDNNRALCIAAKKDV